MRKNYVQGIILHTSERTGAPSQADRISEFHTYRYCAIAAIGEELKRLETLH